MKLTIDSTEALEDTLRVVGALYNVTLEVSANQAGDARSREDTGRTQSTATARPRGKARPSQKRNRPTTGQARSAANGSGSVDTAAVRTWARGNGYEIAERGRVPAKVLTAYQKAHNA